MITIGAFLAKFSWIRSRDAKSSLWDFRVTLGAMSTLASATLVLKPNRERSVKRFHPWIMSGSVAVVTGDPQPGDTVAIIAESGDHLAWASYSPRSTLRARVWSFDPDAVINEAFIAALVQSALRRRSGDSRFSHSCRLIFGDADGLPGLIVDRYGEVLVMQITAVGIETWRQVIVDVLAGIDGVTCLYERSDGPDREREGLESRHGVVFGALPSSVVAIDGDETYIIDVVAGHKTGFYLDQRESRALVRSLAPGARVLNVFAYTGSFTVAAQRAGATAVTTVESSAPALEIARSNALANGVDIGEVIEADAYEALRRLRDRRSEYDLIILDPPKYASSASHVDKAARKYKDINILGAKLLAPGGHLLTFSCSGAISLDLFQKIVAGAAVDARRTLRLVSRLGQPADHPVPLNFPEAEYLKGLHLQADEHSMGLPPRDVTPRRAR